MNQSELFAELKRQALEDFRSWLDELEETDISALCQQAENAPAHAPSLASLFGELTALRQDVRLQARASQTAAGRLDELGAKVEEGLVEASQHLGQAASTAKSLVPEARREAQRAIALELVTIIEGLDRCRTATAQVEIPALSWGKRRERLRQQLTQPLDLLAAKGRDAMQRLRLTPIAAVGSPFDPECMRAVGTTREATVPPGHVAAIVRQGYRIGPDILQNAEVNVESP